MTSDPRGSAECSDLGQTALGRYSVKWFWIRILPQMESGRRCLASSETDSLGLPVAFNGNRAWPQSKNIRTTHFLQSMLMWAYLNHRERCQQELCILDGVCEQTG